MSENRMAVRDFDPENSSPLTTKQKAILDALANLPDEEIDLSDIPEHDFSECLPRSSPRPSAAAMRPPPRPNPAATARRSGAGNLEGNGQASGAAGRAGGRGKEMIR